MDFPTGSEDSGVFAHFLFPAPSSGLAVDGVGGVWFGFEGAADLRPGVFWRYLAGSAVAVTSSWPRKMRYDSPQCQGAAVLHQLGLGPNQ